MVFFHHWPIESFQPFGLGIQRDLHIGVTLFFVLSGFLITYRYQDGYELKKAWLFQYFRNRFARIYPLYFILCFLALAPRRDVGLQDWFLNLTLLKGFSDQYKFIGIPPSWSLSVEECFYIAAPLIFLVRDRFRALWVPLAGFAVVALLTTALGSWLNFQSFLAPWKFVALYTIFGRFFEFFVGIWLAEVVTGKRRAPAWSMVKFKTLTGFGGIALTPFVLATLVGGPYYYGQQHPIGIVWSLFVLPIFVALAIHGLMSERTAASSFLSTRFMQFMGKSSYAFYLLHYGWLIPFKTSILLGGDIFSLFFAVNLLAAAFYKWVEEPLQLFFRGEKPIAKPLRVRKPLSEA